MKHFNIRLLLITLLLAVLSGGMMISQAQTSEQSGQVRFAHVIPGLTDVDVYVNENLSVAGLGFGEATTYFEAPAGALNLRVTLAGVTTTLWEQPINIPADEAVTLIASSTDPLAFQSFRDDLTPLALDTSRFMVIHAIANGPDIDFQAAGETVVTGLTYGSFINTIDVPTGAYAMSAAPTGDTVNGEVLPETSFELNSRTSNMLILYGTPNNPQTLILSTAAAPAEDSGFVRLVHGVADAPSVDIFVNEVLVAPSLSYQEYTEHIAVEPGTYPVSIQVAGGGTEILSGELEVAIGDAKTVAAVGTVEALGLNVVDDSIVGLDASTARINVFNLLDVASSVSVALEDGTTLATDLTAGSASDAVDVTATDQPITVEITSGDETVTAAIPDTELYGGVYYTLLALVDGDSIAFDFAPTSLAQTLNSAPGAAEMVVDAGDGTEDTGEDTDDAAGDDETVAQAPTEVPTEVPAEVPTDVPTEAPVEVQPTVPPVEATTAPTATPEPVVVVENDAVTARVLVDANSNLNLRLFPDTNAFIQCQAGSNDVLEVIGRGSLVEMGADGRPINETIPEDADLVDPAEGIDATDDLEPTSTWLYVDIENNGNTVSTWARADFLDVREPDGDAARLADLELVPGNLSGEGECADRPVPAETTARAIVFNLDPGVPLILRMRPEIGENIMERVFSGTELELIGISPAGDWAFVRHFPDEGGTVTGWGSTLYLRYEFRGESLDPVELEEEGLLENVVGSVGERTEDAPPVTQPETDPFRNQIVATVQTSADVPLNFRPRPDTEWAPTAELPNGTQVVVVGRTADGEWLEVVFEGENGWISTDFVTLTFNDRPQELLEIPVTLGTETEGSDG